MCSDCEGILNRMGEKHVLPLLAHEGGFPFHDLLTQIPPDVAEPGLEIHSCAKVPSLHCEKITHFATGIFWKAAIHTHVQNLSLGIIHRCRASDFCGGNLLDRPPKVPLQFDLPTQR